MRVLAPSPASLTTAVNALHHGELVAFPTETVYGQGADATNDAAVAGIFAAKGRPSFNPLIVHVDAAEQVVTLAEITPQAEALMQRYWPGPLTLVLRRHKNCPVSLLCSAGLNTLALRCPAHPLAQELIRATGRPIAAPSANRSGQISPTAAQHVAEGFRTHPHPRFNLVLAGGRCSVGLESTVLDLTTATPTILRPGAILAEQISETLGRSVALAGESAAIKSPGQLASHYAPQAPVRLNTRSATAAEAYLGFGPSKPNGAGLQLNLSENGDLEEAAGNLFAYLHQLDATHPAAIAVAPIPLIGLGIAINDRLNRAAYPRAMAN